MCYRACLILISREFTENYLATTWTDYYNNNYYTGSASSFSGLTKDGKIVVASSVTAFVVGSIFIGFLCGHFCQKESKVIQTGTISQCDHEKIQGAPYYEDVVLNQHEQELELKENVAYAPVL